MNEKIIIQISDIDARDRLRPVDALKVEAISAAIEEKGLIQPIVVRLRADGEGYQLIAGAHRLAALTLLGKTELIVGAEVVIREEASDEEARLSEIYENVFRGELSALDRAIHLATAKSIHEAKRGETRGRKRKDVEFKEGKIIPETGIIFSERFTKDAAKRIGLSEASIQEAIQIFNALDPKTIDAIRGTMVENNQNELRQLAELPKAQQVDAAKRIAAGEARNVTQARVAIGLDRPVKDDPQKRIYDALLDNWNRASKTTRAQFMSDAGLIQNKSEAA